MPAYKFALGIVLVLSVFSFHDVRGEEDSDELKEHWIKTLLNLNNHNQTAFQVGPKLILINPKTALAAVQEAWPRIEKKQVKTGILKAFAFGKALRPKKHPKVLNVLHLGMTDQDQYVREYAAVYLRDYTNEDFKKHPDKYAAWYKKFGDQPPETVIRLNKVRNNTKPKPQDALADVADVPAEDLRVGSNERMRYFRIGPRKNVKAPEDGYKLVVIMPGGDGGERFHPFVRRIYKHSFGDDYLAVQPVAFKWNQRQRIVWPTRTNSVEGQKFSTEEFVESVIQDVSKTFPIDKDFIFTLSWSSSGPAAYAVSLAEKTSVTGSYVAMSVFKPDTLPPLKRAGGHAYFLDHSPQDRVCPYRMAKAAEEMLQEKGAAVMLNSYEGGHGWHGDVYGRVTRGIEWLEKQQSTGE